MGRREIKTSRACLVEAWNNFPLSHKEPKPVFPHTHSSISVTYPAAEQVFIDFCTYVIEQHQLMIMCGWWTPCLDDLLKFPWHTLMSSHFSSTKIWPFCTYLQLQAITYSAKWQSQFRHSRENALTRLTPVIKRKQRESVQCRCKEQEEKKLDDMLEKKNYRIYSWRDRNQCRSQWTHG